MNSEIYIRPLAEDDANLSYKWRNDSEVWKYTGSRPAREITAAQEREWIREVLSRPSEKRFAICLIGTDEYIGNVQLTGITKNEAEFHIFIGAKKYWGRGYGTAATRLGLDFAFESLNLKRVLLEVKKSNVSAIRAYEKAGFTDTGDCDSLTYRFEIHANSS